MLRRLFDDRGGLKGIYDMGGNKFFHIIASLGDWAIGFEVGISKWGGPNAPLLLLLIDDYEQLEYVSLQKVLGEIQIIDIPEVTSAEIVIEGLEKNKILTILDHQDDYFVVNIQGRQYILCTYERQRGKSRLIRNAERVGHVGKSNIFSATPLNLQESHFLSSAAKLYVIKNGKFTKLNKQDPQ